MYYQVIKTNYYELNQAHAYKIIIIDYGSEDHGIWINNDQWKRKY